MHYDGIRKAIFRKRINRFVAIVEVDKRAEKCHVKNTGRLAELLVEGVQIYVQNHDDPNRKTAYSLIAVEKDGQCVNIDSQAPNCVAGEWIRSGCFLPGITYVKAEQKLGNSRLDYYFEANGQPGWMEVKGVTLNLDGIACFPDAPTERGIKHVEELANISRQGIDAYLLFVIQTKGIRAFMPNNKTQPKFGEALIKAQKSGVHILAYDCLVGPDLLVIDQKVPVCL